MKARHRRFAWIGAGVAVYGSLVWALRIEGRDEWAESHDISGTTLRGDSIVALLIATIAQMVLGELIPKTYAIARPLPTASAVAPNTSICPHTHAVVNPPRASAGVFTIGRPSSSPAPPRRAVRLGTRGSALALVPSAAGAQGSRAGSVPPGQMPPAGMCRVWFDGVAPGRQPAPTDCATARGPIRAAAATPETAASI